MARKKRLLWEGWYALAAEYYSTHGDLLVPRDFVTRGERLGRWVERQRAGYYGKRGYGIDDDRIKALEAIGMVWRLEVREEWDVWLRLAGDYRLAHGDLMIPAKYVTGQYALGNWLKIQRCRRRRGELTEEQIASLDSLGIEWDVIAVHPRAYWLNLCREYYSEHGDLSASYGYVTKGGDRLGQWLYTQREKYRRDVRGRLTDDQIAELEGLGMKWT